MTSGLAQQVSCHVRHTKVKATETLLTILFLCPTWLHSIHGWLVYMPRDHKRWVLGLGYGQADRADSPSAPYLNT